jgi:hypothetical protein
MQSIKNIVIIIGVSLFFFGCGADDSDKKKLTLFAVKAGNNWGYVDSTCSFKLEPLFENAGEFYNSRAFVLQAGRAGYINDSATLICNFHFLKATDFSENKAFVLDTLNTIQCIDINAKTLFSLKDVEEANVFYEDMAAIKKNDKYGFIDTKGNEIISCQYDAVLCFSEGLCAVAKSKVQGDSTVFIWQYIDKTGKAVLKDYFETALNFTSGFAAVCKKGKWTWIDKKGNSLFANNYEQCQSFNEGLATYKKNGYWGIIDTSGKIILEPSYAEIGNFSNGLAVASLGPNTVGYINKLGVIAISPIYQSASRFKNGVAYVFNNHKISMLTIKGVLFCSGQFDSAPGFLGEDLGFVHISMNTQISINKPLEQSAASKM